VTDAGGLVPSVAWRLGDSTEFCVDGQVLTAGSAVSWLQGMGWISGAEDLDRLASTVSGSDGVTFVPSFAGLAAPRWAPDARAQVRGLSLAHEPGHLVRGFLEGLASLVAELASASAEATGVPVSSLRVDGGLTRSRALMQAQADLLQGSVQVHSSPHATAVGAGILALASVRRTTDLASVVPATERWEEFVPQMSADEAESIRARVRGACRDEDPR
jgi:glycerol kinase